MHKTLLFFLMVSTYVYGTAIKTGLPKKVTRDPFSWHEESEKEIEVSRQSEPEPVKPKPVATPTYVLKGIILDKKEAHALLVNGTSFRTVKHGTDIGHGWQIKTITKEQVGCEHVTGEKWVLEL